MQKEIQETICRGQDEKLRSIFLAAPVGIGMVINRVIVEVNDTLCRMTGYSKDEMTGKDSLFLYPTEDDYNYVGKEKYDQIKATGLGTVETRWKKKDGTIIDIILSSAPLDRDDLSSGVTFTALDITERKKAEQALMASECRFKTYMEHSPDAIFIADNNGIILDVNSRAAEMTGYEINELLDHHIKDVHIKEEIPFALNMFDTVLKKGKTRFEFRLKRKDGGNIPVLMESALLPDGRIIGYCRDITERKNYEERLKQYAARVKNIADNIPGLLYQYNVSSGSRGFSYISEKAGDIFGIDINRDDYLEEYISHVHPDYRESFILSIEESIKNRTSWNFEWPFIHNSGETRWYRGRSNPEINDDGLIFYGEIQDITDEKESKTALGQSEARYKELVELAADGIMLASRDGVVLETNTSTEQITGCKKEDFIGKHVTDFFTPEELHKKPIRFDLLLNGETVQQERDFIKKDGTIITLDIHSKMMPDGNLQAIIHDITERKRNDEALATSEARYRELVELAVDGILLVSDEGVISAINSQIEKMTGKKKEHLIGLNISELFTKKSLMEKPLRIDLLKKGETVINERVLNRDDGIPVMVETHSKMMPDGVFQSIFRDITERKLSEEALASEKERLAVTLRSIGDGVIATDTEGRILLMNSVAEKLTGWNFEECADKKLNDIFRIINELTKEPETDIIQSVMKSGEVVELSINTILLSKNGGEIIISDSGAPIKDSEGTITGVVLVFRDMTEKRKLIESLQRAQKLDSLATLAGGIAHDFNNMLGGMLGYIDLARRYSRNGENITAYLDKAMTVFDRARNLTGQLMTFARGGDPCIKTESIEPVLKEFTISALNGSDIKCSFNIAEGLWLCNFDSGQIGQVVYNIVTNAREFMSGGNEVIISAENVIINEKERTLLKPGKYVKVEVSDRGKGIPPDILSHIFDPFFTTKKKGNGLGLSTSYSIILRHGGLLDVESVYSKGSKFWFYLPATTEIRITGSGAASAEHHGSGIIMIMDDEAFIREIISQMLSHMGYKTLQAADGHEMMSLFSEYGSNPELKCIILDLTIPAGMGGKETVTEIRKLDKKIPVFASSGYSNDNVMSNPETYGFTDSIRKPFTMNELSALLNMHLKNQDQ